MTDLAHLCAALLLASGPVWAKGHVFTPPEGCTPQLTVQKRSCQVLNIYTCAPDAPGDQWGVTLNQSGPTFVSRIDHETQWMESFEFYPAVHTTLRPPADDPASLSELLESGIDTYDFVQNAGGRIERVVGFDRLTGEKVVIDDEPLLKTEFSMRFETFEGTILKITGTEYVSTKHRRFFGGQHHLDWGDQAEDRNQTPVEFIYPGEDGFFAAKPKHDCEETLAAFRQRS